ncbi:MAG: nitrous oxide reductase family maturation protein NosD [Ardenticatenaceae bacterium]|nr:nitrous oxide reductase family maturation protein NosD [Ardenticatenaceae bacterium]HBY97486.1 nitrous oxide reductase family maturation protein NosD [Chloroflexota bacterium]
MTRWLMFLLLLLSPGVNRLRAEFSPAAMVPIHPSPASTPVSAHQAQHSLVVSPQGPYTTIEAALAAAHPGDTIEVHGGTYAGPLVVDKTVTLIGRDGATVDGQGQGTVLTVAARGAVVRGFVIRGSGESHDRENAGVVLAAPETTLEESRLEDVLFGVTVAQAPHSVVRGNTITGKPLPVALRGDGLRVWESPETLVENNHLIAMRDLLLWYSDGTTVRGNTVEQGRYGLHFMFNNRTTIEGNVLRGNSVGVYLMYSNDIAITQNSLLTNRGPSGYGLGLKDVNRMVATGNLFLDNRVGVYLDNSPLEIGVVNRFEGNTFAFNDIGLSFLPQVKNNVFTRNSFVENGQQLSIEGNRQFMGNVWTDPTTGVGNYWSDYAGYDADHDGQGDLPYRNESLFESLMDRRPELRLFLLSPAAQAVDLAARAFPLVAPQPRLTDEAPLMAFVPLTDVPLPPPASPRPLLAASLFLLGLAALIIGRQWPVVRRWNEKRAWIAR